MAKYFANNNMGGTQQAMTTTFKTLVELVSSATTKRIRVFEIKCGQNGTPASSDNSIEFDVSTVSATGTGTAVTPTKFDPADGAALTAAEANSTIEPTVTANSATWGVGGNQRAPFYWVALTDAAQLIYPATSGAGCALRCKSPGYTGTAYGSVSFDE